MDPVTAIQVVSAVFSFVQAGAAVLKTAKEIRDSADGLSDDSRSRRVVVESMQGAIKKLRATNLGEKSSDQARDTPLFNLVVECEDLSGRIEKCLGKIQKSKFGRLGSASKALLRKDELEALETRLGHCRGQLELELGNLRE